MVRHMRIIYKRIDELNAGALYLGYVGENEHTQVILDCASVFYKYPNAVPAVTVRPPLGSTYPAIINRSGNTIVWNIIDSDLVNPGTGEIQVAFTENSVVIKSCIGSIRIDESIIAKGDIPAPIDDWLVNANTALNNIPQTIINALANAKASGQFDGADGQDGFSPTITAEKENGITAVSITDKTGTTVIYINDGEKGDKGDPGESIKGDKGDPGDSIKGDKGDPGISPTVSVTDIPGGHRITVTDADGPHTFDVMNGSPGDPTEIIDDSGNDANKVWSAQKTNEIKTELQNAVNAKYTKPADGIPATDLASGIIPSVLVQDVQVNGETVINPQGVANIPLMGIGIPGVAKLAAWSGITIDNGVLNIQSAGADSIKGGSSAYYPIVPNNQHISTFYGLAKAAGAFMHQSTNPVGTYTDVAKTAIQKNAWNI